MTRIFGKLTALRVRHETRRGIHWDGQGLGMQINGTGGRAWVLRYRYGGRRHHYGLGAVSKVSLSEARVLASTARGLLAEGIDPITARTDRRTAAVLKATVHTFADIADRYFAAHSPSWSDKSAKGWTAGLANHVLPIIGKVPVEAIDTEAVLMVLRPLWAARKVVTGKRIRSHIEAALDAARAQGLRDGENPARWRGHLDQLLAAPSKIAKVDHHPALPFADLPQFMIELRARDDIGSRALQFAILTAVRSGEVFGATWGELDLTTATWTIPASRMKAKRDHRVPLSGASVALLGTLPGPRGDGDYVFAGFKAGRPLAKMTMANVLKRMGRDSITVHGFRACFSTWANETTAYPHELIEVSLAHTTGNQTSRAYNRGDLLARRVKLMQQWSDYCAGKVQPSATVTQLKRPA